MFLTPRAVAFSTNFNKKQLKRARPWLRWSFPIPCGVFTSIRKNDRGYADNAAVLSTVMLTMDHVAVSLDVTPKKAAISTRKDSHKLDNASMSQCKCG